MTLFNVYDVNTSELIAKRLVWEEFITKYGWKPEYKVISWDE